MSLLSFYFYRKYIISRKQAEVPLSVPFDPRNQVGRPLVAPVGEFRLTWLHLLIFIINAVKFFAGVSELQQCFRPEDVGH